MATHYLPLLNSHILPDNGGDVYPVPFTVAAVNDRWDPLVWNFANSGGPDLINGLFRVPNNLVANAILNVLWTANAIVGSAFWQFRYRCVAAGASLDQLGEQETVNVTVAAPAAAFGLVVATVALTTANLVPGNLVEFDFGRDSGVAGDNLAAAALLFALDLSFDDQ